MAVQIKQILNVNEVFARSALLVARSAALVQNSPKQPKKAKTSTLSPDQKNDIIRCVLKRLLRIANKKIWWREMAALRAVPPIIKLASI